ncbi:MAG TPA: hypothetical protein QGF58_11375 [Myxococcota bacterium]|jgi:hypothetical protein|nr:hypothetical protein [Myxococcota bacterium]
MSDMPDDYKLLEADAVDWRLEGIRRLKKDRDAMVGMLNDDAPFLFKHGDAMHISEVRMRALVALQDHYRKAGRAWDLGPVPVRRAMSAADAEKKAMAVLASLPERGRKLCLHEAEQFLDQRVQPFDKQRPPLRAYRVLQQLSRVRYEIQEPLPGSLLTPLQLEVQESQLVSERPRPHLRFSGSSGVLGYVYVAGGKWVLDFAEGAESEALEGSVRAAIGQRDATNVNDLSGMLTIAHEVVA